MDRRNALAAAGGALAALAGCLDDAGGDTDAEGSTTGTDAGPTADGTVEASLAVVDAERAVDDPPSVAVDGDDVVVRGTVRYGSSRCGTVRLAHAGYEGSQDRLDLLVVAGDDPAAADAPCTDDLVTAGYRVEATVPERLRRVAATEHHVFGATYSASADLTDY